MAQDSGTLAGDMAHKEEHARVRLGPQGRIVIPAALRRALGLEVGTELHATAEDGRLVLRTREQALRELRDFFAGAEGDVLQELFAERRREFEKELAEYEEPDA